MIELDNHNQRLVITDHDGDRLVIDRTVHNGFLVRAIDNNSLMPGALIEIEPTEREAIAKFFSE